MFCELDGSWIDVRAEPVGRLLSFAVSDRSKGSEMSSASVVDQQHQNSSNVAEQVVVTSLPVKQWVDNEVSLSQGQQSDYRLVSGSSSTISAYIPGYYSPYVSVGAVQGQPVGENIVWASAEPVTYISGYDVCGNYISESPFFGGVDYPQHLSYNWIPGIDYSEWNASAVVGGSQGYAEGYYFLEGVGIGMENYLTSDGDQPTDTDVNSLQQSLDRMRLEEGRQQFSYAMSSIGVSSLGQNGSWMPTASQYSHPSKVLRAPQNSLDSGTWGVQSVWDGTPRPHNSVGAGRDSSAAGTVPPKLEFDSAVHTTYATADGSQTVLRLGLPYDSTSSQLNVGQYNPSEFSLNLENARFFIIKSYSEDDVHRSIKHGIWCSTEYGNKRLDTAYQECNGQGSVYLLFSVNGSGHFCGIAEMTSHVDYHATSTIWAQNKWKGQFEVQWIYVKDVPNSQLRHIKLENNENKPVTNSRDTQEVPPDKGKQVVCIIHQYRHTTSIFDDFRHYELRQEDERKNKENYGI